MQTRAIDEIEQRLRELPPEKLDVVRDFVDFLAERQGLLPSRETILASEAVLRRDWERDEEDEAWRHL